MPHCVAAFRIQSSGIVFWLCAFCVVVGCQFAFGENQDAEATDLTGEVIIFDRAGSLVDDRSGVVVFVDGISASVQVSSANAANHLEASISQRGGRYTPGLIPIVKGTTIQFVNDDSTFHNVFSLSKSKVFDLGIYARDTSKPVTFDQSGLVRVYCNIHPDMVSKVLVLENGWFALTKADGTFRISGIPQGDYQLRAWSDLSDGYSSPIASRGTPIQVQPIVLKRTKRAVKHKNKYGKAYSSKY